MYSSSEMHSPSGNQLHNGWNSSLPFFFPDSVHPTDRVTRFMGDQLLDSAAPKTGPDLQLMPWTGVNLENSEDNLYCPLTAHKSFKRKIIQETGDYGQVRKQLITEDKISAHLSQLSLSQKPTAEKPNSELSAEVKNPTLIDGLQLTESSKLVLSQELRRFQQESNIPTSLLESFSRPTMAVVLWHPRNPVHDLLNNREASETTRTTSRNIRTEEHAGEEVMDDLPEDNNNEPMNNLNFDEMAGHQPPFIDDMDEDL